MVAIPKRTDLLSRLGVTVGHRWLGFGSFALFAVGAIYVTAVDVTQEQIPLVARTAAPYRSRPRELIIDEMIKADPAAAASADIQKLAHEALARDQTSVVAVRSLGLAAAAQGDNKKADRLMDSAQLLSRRDVPTQFYFIQRAVDMGKVDDALAHFDIALRVNRPAQNALFPILANAIRDRPVATAFAKLLASNPEWAPQFVEYASGQAAAVGALALVMANAAKSSVSNDPKLQRLVLARLADNGAWMEASALYRAIAKRSLDEMAFSAAALPPFEWTWATGAAIGATTANDRRFEYRANANAGGVLGERVSLLGVGHYRATITSTGDQNMPAAGPALEIRCLSEKGEALLTLPIPQSGRPSSAHFVVPPNCPAQNIRFSVRAIDDPDGQNGTLSNFSIAAVSR